MSDLKNNIINHINASKTQSVFKIKDGVLYGFTDEFLSFANKNFVLNLYNDEHIEKAKKSELGAEEKDQFNRLKMFVDLMNMKFSDTENLTFKFVEFTNLKCDIHLDNLKHVHTINAFPEFDYKRKVNYELPDACGCIDYFVTKEQLLNSKLDNLSPRGEHIVLTNVLNEGEFQNICQYWAKPVVSHIDNYIKKQLSAKKPNPYVFTIHTLASLNTSNFTTIMSQMHGSNKQGNLSYSLRLYHAIPQLQEILDIIDRQMPDIALLDVMSFQRKNHKPLKK